MNIQGDQSNRACFPIAELKSYDGQWVAFSMDGRRSIAGSHDLGELDKLIVAAGESPEEVALERIEFNDVSLGGAELA